MEISAPARAGRWHGRTGAALSGAIGGNPDPVLLGEPRLARAYETGWKDTIIAPPGIALETEDLYFDYAPDAGSAVYVWHCHITYHEDREMMRPMKFRSHPRARRTYLKGSTD